MLRLKRAEDPREVVLFGSGTIGGQVVRHLQRSGWQVFEHAALPWTDPEGLRSLTAGLFSEITARPVDLVWAAGAAGFGAGEREAELELEAFTIVIEAFERLVADRGTSGSAIHMLSSAGGLFEGMHVRSVDTPPRPLRPYGRLKLEEEHRVGNLGRSMAVHIHRPSSVYTDARAGRRPGLIGALVANGLRRSPTPIIGAFETLRDYVHARDIGRFVANGVDDATREPGVHMSFLVGGEPASIHRVIHTVEQIMRRRLLIQISEAWNAADITFANSVRHPAFQPMGLVEGASITLLAAEEGRADF